MSNIFEQWDNNFDTEGLQKDINEAAENGGGTYKDVPHGKYEVAVEKMELKATKEKGNPMVSIWFKVVSEGDCEGSMIFMNQVITQGFQIHIVNELLRSMVAECTNAPAIEFKTFAQYSELLLDVHELIAESFEFALDYGVTKKGFDTFKITEVYTLEG